MFSGLYNTGIFAYQLLFKLASAFNSKARLWVEGRQNWPERLAQEIAKDNRSESTRSIAWFHAASLGEFEQGRPVIEAFRQQYPEYKILLTFFSPSGYEVRKNYEGADYVVYLPADTPANAREFVRLVDPKLAFFIKYEFWYNYLRTLKTAQIPIVSFSAIFRSDQLFFKPWGVFYRNLLRYFDHILVQNQESVELLTAIGISQVTLAGDTRFDRVAQVALEKKEIPLARLFKNGQPLLVVGSAWPEDMQVLIPFLNSFNAPLKIIIAPHEIHDEEIEQWRMQLTKSTACFSKTTKADVSQVDVLFIDNVGMLSSLYQYGEFAYIGGAFKQGLHNILEAATFGMPLFFGPDYGNYQEAIDLVKAGAAFPVSSSAYFVAAFNTQYADRSQAARISREYVQRNIGATAQVMNVVQQLVSTE